MSWLVSRHLWSRFTTDAMTSKDAWPKFTGNTQENSNQCIENVKMSNIFHHKKNYLNKHQSWSKICFRFYNPESYQSVQRWQAVEPQAAPTCPVEGEGTEPPVPAGRNWELQCWTWAQPPGYSPWCACLQFWLGTCARPVRGPRQRIYPGTDPEREEHWEDEAGYRKVKVNEFGKQTFTNCGTLVRCWTIKKGKGKVE